MNFEYHACWVLTGVTFQRCRVETLIKVTKHMNFVKASRKWIVLIKKGITETVSSRESVSRVFQQCHMKSVEGQPLDSYCIIQNTFVVLVALWGCPIAL